VPSTMLALLWRKGKETSRGATVLKNKGRNGG
jgi:hypothetical protein